MELIEELTEELIEELIVELIVELVVELIEVQLKQTAECVVPATIEKHLAQSACSLHNSRWKSFVCRNGVRLIGLHGPVHFAFVDSYIGVWRQC